MYKPELLLPAGSFESLKAAVFGGADAVYIGLPEFSARAKAQNFTLAELGNAIDFAHLYGVKVYIAANTLIKNHELADFFKQIDAAYRSHADAIIVQSLQLGTEIKKRYPNLCLHASTQMGLHSVDGVKLAKDAGFCRVILSREAPLADIRKIKSSVDIEVEVFVHGALCVSFSGGCYMSSFISGNSGNRGRCLQPCRQSYAGERMGGGDYKLSLSDISSEDNLAKLADAGVDSFKIEGRMRSPEYCYYAAQVYSRLVAGKNVDKTLRLALATTYNRGNFTKGHAFDDIDIVSDKTPSNIGVCLGYAQKTNQVDIAALCGGDNNKNNKAKADAAKRVRGAFILKSDSALNPKDGFKLLTPDGREKGGAIYRGQRAHGGYVLYSDNAPSDGDMVCRTKDINLTETVARLDKKLPINITFFARPEKVPYMILKYGEVSVEVNGNASAETALGDKEALHSSYLKAAAKLGDSAFYADDIDIDTQNAFIPISAVNDMRRRAATILRDAIIANFRNQNNRCICNLYKKDDSGAQKPPNIEQTGQIETIKQQDKRTDARADSVLPHLVNDGQNDSIKAQPTAAKEAVAAQSDNVQTAPSRELAVIYDGKLHKDMFLAKHIILKPDDYNLQTVKNLLADVDADKTYLYLPALMREKDQDIVKDIILKLGIGGVYANSLGGVQAARETGASLFAGMGLNIFNDIDAGAYADSATFCYSKELTLEEIAKFSHRDGYVFAYGKVLVMTLNHCFYRSLNKVSCGDCPYTGIEQLKDKTGAEFFISRNRISKCYFEVYNGKVLNALSRGIQWHRLLLNLCGMDYAAAKDTLQAVQAGSLVAGGYGYTTGHLYRGVK